MRNCTIVTLRYVSSGTQNGTANMESDLPVSYVVKSILPI